MDMHSWSSWDQQAVETLVLLRGSKEPSAFNAVQSPVATKTRRARTRASSPWYEATASQREDSSSPSEEGADCPNDHDYTTSRLRHTRPASSQRAARAAGRAHHEQAPATTVAHKLLKKHAPTPSNSATLLTSLPLLSAFFAPATPSTSAPSRPTSAAFSAPGSPLHASPAASGDHTSATSSRLATETTAETKAPAAGLKRPASPLNSEADVAAVVRARKVPRTSILSAIASAAAGAHASIKAPSTVAVPPKPVLPQRRPLPLARSFTTATTHSRLAHAVSVNATGMAHLQPVHLLATFPVQRMGVLTVGEAPA